MKKFIIDFSPVDILFSCGEYLCKLLNSEESFEAHFCTSRSLRARVARCNQMGGECFINIHTAYFAKNLPGSVTAYVLRHRTESSSLASKMIDEVSKRLGILNGGVRENKSLFILRNTAFPAIVIEFSLNASDMRRLGSMDFALADALYKGICRHFCIKPSFAKVAAEDDFEAYLAENPATGYIKAQTLAGRSLIPINSAVITVTKNLNGKDYELARVSTDANGQTELIALPTKSASMSQSPTSLAPYAIYDIKAEHPEFASVTNFNVPIFDGVLSIQTMRMNTQGSPEKVSDEQSFENLRDS